MEGLGEGGRNDRLGVTAHYGEEDGEETAAERLGGDVAISCGELAGSSGGGDGSGFLLRAVVAGVAGAVLQTPL